jgi:secreted Zn-dependent insulinase-like peptidase
MAEDDKNASLSTTTKHLTTSFDEAVKLWRLTVFVKTMDTNYYHVTRLITTLQSYKERRTRSFDAVIVVIDDGESFRAFLLHLFSRLLLFSNLFSSQLLEFTLGLLI